MPTPLIKMQDDNQHLFEANDDQNMATILDNVDALIYVCDMQTNKLIYVNEYGRKIWGDVQGKTCWKVLQKGQSSPCSFCTNERLLDSSGQPTGPYVWESKNSVNQRWYQCRDQAIRWHDGRMVRLEIATDITERKKVENELATAKRRAEKLALQDALTGLNNRRALFEFGHLEFAQSMRYQHPLSIIMMDIDHFKLINDRYGHAIGDRALCVLANLLRFLVRDIDIIARVGGEEFVFVLPETNTDAAMLLAERLRSNTEQLLIDSDEHQFSITASFGIATNRAADKNFEMLLRRADKALYEAKKSGRNRIQHAH